MADLAYNATDLRDLSGQMAHLKGLGTTFTNLERALSVTAMGVTGTAAGTGIVGMGNDVKETIETGIDFLQDAGFGQADVSVVAAGR